MLTSSLLLCVKFALTRKESAGDSEKHAEKKGWKCEKANGISKQSSKSRTLEILKRMDSLFAKLNDFLTIIYANISVGFSRIVSVDLVIVNTNTGRAESEELSSYNPL